jgi:hypothetical protein
MQKRTTVTREPPTRGSIKDYQDWLVEQLRASVDYYSTGASLNDLAWAEWVVRAEEQRDRAKSRLRRRNVHDADCASYLVDDDGERLYNCNCGHDAALADEPPKETP